MIPELQIAIAVFLWVLSFVLVLVASLMVFVFRKVFRGEQKAIVTQPHLTVSSAEAERVRRELSREINRTSGRIV
jgi:hypothetical protein